MLSSQVKTGEPQPGAVRAAWDVPAPGAISPPVFDARDGVAKKFNAREISPRT